MTCASCSAPLVADARFCQRCGAAAPEAVAPAADPIRETLKVALGRQYEVLGLLGRGGMGAVYLATEAALEREVAIKVLPPDRGATKESRDRFRREARTAAKLSHPNIVPLYTFGDVDGTLYFVMGYVKGESLAARLKREGRLPVEESRRILIEIAEALEYAHKLGVIHRDIKPDNVLLEEGTGRALLTDFGVAKALGAGQTMTEVGSVLGTPQYMSPEQAQGKADIDHRTDIYSLGVMGYAMLAGRLPFEGPTAGDIMAQHITKEAPPLRSFAPDVPVEIATALTRSLAKDPTKRWPDAQGLKRALTISEEDEGPPQLDGLEVFFVAPILGFLLLACLAAWWIGGGDVSDSFPALVSIVITATVTPFLLLPWRWLHLRRIGFEGEVILRGIFQPLQGWFGWYPRRFRRRHDVWDRLPAELRHFRLAIGWALLSAAVVAPVVVLDFGIVSHMRRTGRRPFESINVGDLPDAVGAVVMALLAATSLTAFRFELFRRRRGVDPHVSSRMIRASTANRAYWARPENAALLNPAPSSSGAGQPVEPTTAPGLADAVTAIASRLPESLHPLGREAQSAARVLADSIAALDRRIAGLIRAFDPAEIQRLNGRLEALGPASDTDDENKELREASRRQLDALRDAEARLGDARRKREIEFGHLRSMWSVGAVVLAASGDSARLGAAARLQELVSGVLEKPAAQRMPSEPGATAAISDAPTIER